jgi:PIN domain nuclease of toxin-antitoxin system
LAILLDTHALVWTVLNDPRLGQKARGLVVQAVARRDAWICPVTFWEVQNGIDRRRITVGEPVQVWRAKLLAAGFQERPTTGDDTILQAQLTGLHKDPADRLLVAVAINAGWRLVTADEKLLAWTGKLDRFDCRD